MSRRTAGTDPVPLAESSHSDVTCRANRKLRGSVTAAGEKTGPKDVHGSPPCWSVSVGLRVHSATGTSVRSGHDVM